MISLADAETSGESSRRAVTAVNSKLVSDERVDLLASLVLVQPCSPVQHSLGNKYSFKAAFQRGWLHLLPSR